MVWLWQIFVYINFLIEIANAVSCSGILSIAGFPSPFLIHGTLSCGNLKWRKNLIYSIVDGNNCNKSQPRPNNSNIDQRDQIQSLPFKSSIDDKDKREMINCRDNCKIADLSESQNINEHHTKLSVFHHSMGFIGSNVCRSSTKTHLISNFSLCRKILRNRTNPRTIESVKLDPYSLQLYMTSFPNSCIPEIPDNEKINIGINGFGRIGRILLRSALKDDCFKVTAINCSMSPEYMAYLLKYDSTHGTLKDNIDFTADKLIINNNDIRVYHTRNPAEIPWKESGAKYVCESTGAFCTSKDAALHITHGGCDKVVISAPAKDEETPTFVIGVNSDDYDSKINIVSCASCTTNALAPIVKVLNDNFGFVEGLMSTIHAATNTQNVVDSNSKKDWRGGRSAMVNIIPSSTGAAKAVVKCLPSLKGKITGVAFRVPTVDVSVVDLTCRLEKEVTYDEIKNAMLQAAQQNLRGILGVTDVDVVSQDFIGSTLSSIFDVKAGIMLNKHFFKLVSWYDNEAGYANRILDMFKIMHGKTRKK